MSTALSNVASVFDFQLARTDFRKIKSIIVAAANQLIVDQFALEWSCQQPELHILSCECESEALGSNGKLSTASCEL